MAGSRGQEMQSTVNYLWHTDDLLGQGATASVYKARNKVGPSPGHRRPPLGGQPPWTARRCVWLGRGLCTWPCMLWAQGPWGFERKCGSCGGLLGLAPPLGSLELGRVMRTLSKPWGDDSKCRNSRVSKVLSPCHLSVPDWLGTL